MYSVRTRVGTVHNFVQSWTKWSLDDSFIEFVQAESKSSDAVKHKLIIPKNEILSISVK